MDEQPPSPTPRRSPRRIVRGLVSLLVLAIALFFLVYSPIFTLQHIAVDGTSALQEQDIWRITGAVRGAPLFTLKTDALTARLESDLRVESAAVRRVLPDTLAVHIVERRPLASLATDYGYADVDRTGRILAARKSLGTMQLPLITGAHLGSEYIGDTVSDENVKKALTFLEKLDSTAIASLSELSVQDPDAITAYTTKAVQIRLGDLSDLERKAKLTQGFLEDQQTTAHPALYVDFTYKTPFIKLRD